MKTAPLFVAAILAGCDYNIPQQDWERAPREHVCTPEQMRRVEVETKWCSENTSYLKTYCYGSAFIRNCTKKPPEKSSTGLAPTKEK